MHRDDDLTPEETRALAGLAESPDPPARLEDAVVARLAEEGWIRRGGRRPARPSWLLAIAAGVALFAAGLAVGARRGTPAPNTPAAAAASSTRYVLFLYDAPDEPSLSAEQMQTRVAEYRDWAVGLRRAGSDISGEKLAPQSLDLGASAAAPGPLPLGGYFVFSAPDAATARAIAASCPHLRHGGRAALRPIEET